MVEWKNLVLNRSAVILKIKDNETMYYYEPIGSVFLENSNTDLVPRVVLQVLHIFLFYRILR